MHPIDRLWLIISSLRLTSVLAILLSALVALAVVVPQGWEALELLAVAGSDDLRNFHVWGLTEVLESPWLKALLVLLLVNVVAVFVRRLGDVRTVPESLPEGSELELDLHTVRPEDAPEIIRATLGQVVGRSPDAENVEGAKVTYGFDTRSRSALLPLMSHLGLVVLVLGAGLLSQPVARSRAIVKALLEVTDSKTQTAGMFDLAQSEEVQFFQWRPRYVIRDFVRSKSNLGPAVRVERMEPEGRRQDFWVYQNAPAGFDQRHRDGLVYIRALDLDVVATPGHGLSSQPASALVVLGLALLLVGGLSSSRPAGRLWAVADGDTVRLVGVPDEAGDPAFARLFERAEVFTRAHLEQS